MVAINLYYASISTRHFRTNVALNTMIAEVIDKYDLMEEVIR